MPQVESHEERAYHVERDPQRLAEDLDLGSRKIADWMLADGLVPCAVLELPHVYKDEKKDHQSRPDHGGRGDALAAGVPRVLLHGVAGRPRRLGREVVGPGLVDVEQEE